MAATPGVPYGPPVPSSTTPGDDVMTRFLSQIQSSPGPATGGASASDPPVWWWSQGANMLTRNRFDQMLAGETRPLSDVQGEFYRWTDAQRNEWADYLTKLGLLEPGERDWSTLRDLWNDVASETARFTAAGKKLTPWQVAALVAGGDNPGGAGGAAKGYTGVKRQVQKNVDLTDPATAKAMVTSVLERTLGRAPTPEELDSFRSVLNAAERANPSVTTTDVTYEDGDAVSSSSQTSGGLGAAGAQQVLMDEAMAKPEWGAYQAATTLYNAFLSSIQSPV